MVAIMSGADNGFFYTSQVMHFSSPFTVFLIYHKQYSPIHDCCFVPRDTYFFERFANENLNYSNNVGINTYSGDTSYKLQVVYNATVARINENY